MSIRIVTLSENTVCAGRYLAEWGLSILVETEKVKVLLDTGASVSAQHNADLMGIDLRDIDKIILSHGHYDHTGGLRQLLRRRSKEIEIIAHPDIWQEKYGRRKNRPARYAGIPFQRAELESLGARFNLTTKPVMISDNVMSTGEIPMTNDFEEVASTLFIRDSGNLQPDMVMDDQALISKTHLGLIVILGCAHRGIINTIHQAQKLTGIEEIHTVVGGCHLVGASKERIQQTIAALKELKVQKLGVSHCTGLPAAVALAREFGESFFFNNAGTITEIPELSHPA